ncbi:TetR/AcrR family transcriptional regulator [Gryllotalpicola reticulitermitis]|uniref:TetR/AcrR family transcriptional regulator n=1 Tax=Gryllotalpicola reticulitermitis TaxID=1184153 RepID=A0ABV8QCB6_9MICO
MDEVASKDADRRLDVLDAALGTFTRLGYRKTSMDDIAKEARISRPGLYFLFSSKSNLFREAAERGVGLDLAAAEEALTASDGLASERIIEAFDAWAGRYIGPMNDTTTVIAENPELLGPVALGGPRRFEAALFKALEGTPLSEHATAAARTLVSLSLGVKHQSATRDEYRARMTDAVRLLLPPDGVEIRRQHTERVQL